jgi:transcriptional regulator with XRE-family HTH domain
MSKKKGPPGYPGDEVIRKEFGKLVRQLRLEKGLSEEQAQAFIDEGLRNDSHPLLPRALALVVRQLREGRKMSRAQLSEVSGIPLRRINQFERAKAADISLTEIVRVAMALEQPVGEFVQKIEDSEQRLKEE